MDFHQDQRVLDVAKRLRRVGFLLLGDQSSVDQVIVQNLITEPLGTTTDFSRRRIDPLVAFAELLLQFEHLHRMQRLAPHRNAAGPKRSSLKNIMKPLSFAERMAVVLLSVEEMDPDDAAAVSGRPALALRTLNDQGTAKIESAFHSPQ